MAICWQIRRQNLIPRFLPANQHPSNSAEDGGRTVSGGANFLSPSTKFRELHRHKQSSTSVKNAYIGEDWTGAGAVSVAVPHPQDTAEKAALVRKLSFCHWERINGLFPPHLLVLFLTVCVLPRSPRNIPLLCQPPPPLCRLPGSFLHALQRQVLRGSCAGSKTYLPRCIVRQPQECCPTLPSSPSNLHHTASKQLNGSA